MEQSGPDRLGGRAHVGVLGSGSGPVLDLYSVEPSFTVRPFPLDQSTKRAYSHLQRGAIRPLVYDVQLHSRDLVSRVWSSKERETSYCFCHAQKQIARPTLKDVQCCPGALASSMHGPSGQLSHLQSRTGKR